MKKYKDEYYSYTTGDNRFYRDVVNLMWRTDELEDDKFIRYYRSLSRAIDDALDYSTEIELSFFTIGRHCFAVTDNAVKNEFLYYLNKHPKRNEWLEKYFAKPVNELVEYIEYKTSEWK